MTSSAIRGSLEAARAERTHAPPQNTNNAFRRPPVTGNRSRAHGRRCGQHPFDTVKADLRIVYPCLAELSGSRLSSPMPMAATRRRAKQSARPSPASEARPQRPTDRGPHKLRLWGGGPGSPRTSFVGWGSGQHVRSGRTAYLTKRVRCLGYTPWFGGITGPPEPRRGAGRDFLAPGGAQRSPGFGPETRQAPPHGGAARFLPGQMRSGVASSRHHSSLRSQPRIPQRPASGALLHPGLADHAPPYGGAQA